MTRTPLSVQVFIVSKLFQTHHVWEGDTSRCAAACDKTLKDMQVGATARPTL